MRPIAEEFRDIAGLRNKWLEHEQRLLTFVRGLSQADLDREMEYKTFKFGVYRNPVWQSMQHVVNHGTYHRGQVTTLLRQLEAQFNPDRPHAFLSRARGRAERGGQRLRR